MRHNVNRIDAYVRITAGVLLSGISVFLLVVDLYVIGGIGVALTLYLFATAALRFAPEYVPFGFATRSQDRGPIRR